MFKMNQILKANPDVVQKEYEQWKGSQVYTKMIENANKYRFQVVSETDSGYLLKRNDGQEMPISKTEAHSYFIIDDNGGDNQL